MNYPGLKVYVPPVDACPIERIDAADVIATARRAATVASALPAVDREAWAKRCEVLMDELAVAVTIFRKLDVTPRPDDWIPPLLRAGVESDAFAARYLKSAKDALTHD